MTQPVADVHDLTADRDGERLDLFIVRRLSELTRSRVRKLIDEGAVSINGETPRKAGVKLAAGQWVRVSVPPPRPPTLLPEPMPLSIVYEDGDLLVIDKPAGLAVHPSPGHSSHTLVHGVLAHCPDLSGIGGEGRPGIVHRLDKDTSGLIIVAKNDAAHVSLARQLKERKVEKTYLALVEGRIEPAEGIIDAPIGRDPRHRKRMAVVERGREARTRYRLLREVAGRSLVEVRPKTGRTHQIRVHLASIGFPICGDALYGRAASLPAGLTRQFLHAHRLAFRHPATGERLELEAPLAEDLAAALAEMGNKKT
ncbi:MAG: RluA family pseudouridine synthase [Chloroflexi bacterium]|nr:RluA family pseudouridine synthase [Chloroflexota bacterium]